MALVGECVETEPSSFEEAVKQPIWVDAMLEEYNSIIQNCVWDAIPRPEDKSVVSSRWLYKVKKVVDGSVEKHMARFVACGFSQVEGINYDEAFAPVVRPTKGVKLQGFIDVDWAGPPSKWKSTSGGIFNLGLAGVSWYSKKQRLVALSSAEAEYMATSQAACEAIWMQKILV
eukprot:PITA_36574